MATDPTLKIIVKRLNSVPLYLWYKQLPNLSIVAIIIAAFPSNKRKERKIIESEKLSINLERGKVRLMRGAIKAAHKKNRKNCHDKKSDFKLKDAKIKQKPPKTAIETL